MQKCFIGGYYWNIECNFEMLGEMAFESFQLALKEGGDSCYISVVAAYVSLKKASFYAGS